MTNQQISDLYIKFGELRDKKLPINVSFAITRNINKMKDIADDIESSRRKLIETYGDRNDNGELIVGENGEAHISQDNLASFNDEYWALMNLETDIALETIKMEDIEKCDLDKYDSLTLAEFAVLEHIIKEDDIVE